MMTCRSNQHNRRRPSPCWLYQVHQSASGWSPVYVTQEGLGEGEEDDVELGVMSIGFMLPNDEDAVIWRGPRKNGLIKQASAARSGTLRRDGRACRRLHS